MNIRICLVLVFLLFAGIPATGVLALESAFVPDKGQITEWLDTVCEPENRRPGEPGGHQVEDFIVQRFQEFGLEQVSKEPVPISLWRAERWSLRVHTANGDVVIPSYFTLNTGFTGESGIKAELVYLGDGTPEDFGRVDVKGKIAVVDMRFAPFPYLPLLLMKGYYAHDTDGSVKWWDMQRATWVRKNWGEHNVDKSAYEMARKNGAHALIWILKDQPTNTNRYYAPYDGVMKDLPALYIGKDDGAVLRNHIESGGTSGTMVQTGTISDGVMHNVYGVLPGKSENNILITSHHDSPYKGYSEDGTGISMVLSLARYYSRIPREQREKSLVFLATAGHFYGSKGIITWLESHPKIVDNSMLNLNIEHVAAREFVEGENGQWEDTGKMSVAGLFVDNNPHLKQAGIEAIKQNDMQRVMVVAIDALGKDPPGEARFTHRLKIPVIHYISGPMYLLVDEDNRDKINMEKLVPSARMFIEMVDKLSSFNRPDLASLD